MKTLEPRASRSPATFEAAPGTRLHYIDWLRVLAVLLLFPFHTLRVFNAGDPFYAKATHPSGAVTYVVNFISVWHMPLFFLLAGASTFFALGRRSPLRYLRERSARLLVPLAFGLAVLIPPQTWYGGRFNSGYSQSYWHYLASGDFLRVVKPGADYYGGLGTGQLWFLQVLFLLCLIALPLFWWGRKGAGAQVMTWFSRCLAHPAGCLLAGFLLLLGAAAPNLLTLNQPIYYLVFFVLGYAVVCDPQFMDQAEKHRLPALTVGVSLALWWTLSGGRLHDSLSSPVAKNGLLFLAMLACWLVIVGLLGYGRRYLDRPSPALAYLSDASYPVYILHQTVIVVAAFYIVRLHVGEPLQWLVLLVSSVAATFLLYELVRRFATTRVLFGMRPARKLARHRTSFAWVAASIVIVALYVFALSVIGAPRWLTLLVVSLPCAYALYWGLRRLSERVDRGIPTPAVPSAPARVRD